MVLDGAAETSTQSIRRLASATLLTNLAIAASSLVVVVIIGRALGPAGRGDVAAFQLIPLIGALVFAFGLPHAASYFAAVRPDAARQVVGSSVKVALAVGIPGAVAVAVIAYVYLATDDSPGIQAAGVVFSISVLLLALAGVLIHPLRSVHRTRLWNALRFTMDMSLISVAAMVLAGQRSLAILALTQIAWLLGVVLIVASVWWRRAERSADPVPTRAIIAFGAPTMLATLPYFLNFRVDQLVLNSVRGSTELGLYATAVSVSAASLPVINTIAMLALPRLAGRTEDRDQAAARFVRSSIAIGLVTAVLLASIAPVAVLVLFGQPFAGSVAYAIPLSFITALLGVTTTAEEVLRAYGDVRFPARAQLVGLAINVALLVALVPAVGAWGAVAASGTTYLGVCVATLSRVRQIATLDTRDMIPTAADVRLLLTARHRATAAPVPLGTSDHDVTDRR